MSQKYSNCFFCGGEVEERLINREVWWKNKLNIIESVPVGVCRQCGQKVLLPKVAKQIDKVLAGNLKPDHFLQVPAYNFHVVGHSA